MSTIARHHHDTSYAEHCFTLFDCLVESRGGLHRGNDLSLGKPSMDPMASWWCVDDLFDVDHDFVEVREYGFQLSVEFTAVAD